MTGPLSDQQLDEIRRRDILKGRGESATTMTQAQTDRRVLLAELDRLRGERDHLTSAFDKLGDQMGELVQAARSERERYTAENRRLRAELDDVAGYLAATHRHASRHDVLGVDLGCAGCALLERIEGGR